MFNTEELLRLYRRFVCSTTERLMNILERSAIKVFGPDIRYMLAKIERSCSPIQTNSR